MLFSRLHSQVERIPLSRFFIHRTTRALCEPTDPLFIKLHRNTEETFDVEPHTTISELSALLPMH